MDWFILYEWWRSRKDSGAYTELWLHTSTFWQNRIWRKVAYLDLLWKVYSYFTLWKSLHVLLLIIYVNTCPTSGPMVLSRLVLVSSWNILIFEIHRNRLPVRFRHVGPPVHLVFTTRVTVALQPHSLRLSRLVDRTWSARLVIRSPLLKWRCPSSILTVHPSYSYEFMPSIIRSVFDWQTEYTAWGNMFFFQAKITFPVPKRPFLLKMPLYKF